MSNILDDMLDELTQRVYILIECNAKGEVISVSDRMEQMVAYHHWLHRCQETVRAGNLIGRSVYIAHYLDPETSLYTYRT